MEYLFDNDKNIVSLFPGLNSPDEAIECANRNLVLFHLKVNLICIIRELFLLG